MKLDVHRRLRALEEAQGMGYGKLVQKLLAIAFLEAGAGRVTERSVQGIDLEVALQDGRRVALEVKTKMAGDAKNEVDIAAKDVKGLQARTTEGYVPYFAVLGNRLLDDWIFAQYVEGEIQGGGAYSPTRLRPYRDRDLERLVSASFDAAVVEHAAAGATGGQGALDEILHAYPSYALA